MKRFLMVQICMILFLLISTSGAGATSMTFTETFLGGDDYFDVWQGWEASFSFNLAALGDSATLKDKDGHVQKSFLPNPDSVNFIPSNYTINAATLDFSFSSRDRWKDTPTIKAGIMDGDEILAVKEYDLGVWYNCNRYDAGLSLDLMDLGLYKYLADGKFISIVLALSNDNWWNWLIDNDFRIDEVKLEVTAHAPEPGTFLLLGIGLIGFSNMVRRKTA